MSLFLKILVIILVLVVLASLAVRLIPIDLENYSKSPQDTPSDGKPHEYRLVGADAPVFIRSADELAVLVDKVIMMEPRTTLIAGSPQIHQLNYRQTTFLMGYPDFIAISIEAISDQESRLNILSHSHYGRSDLGKNKQRVTHWLALLQDALAQN